MSATPEAQAPDAAVLAGLERFYVLFNPSKRGQAGKVWSTIAKKHGPNAAAELNKTLRDKYGCDLTSSDEEQKRIAESKATPPMAKVNDSQATAGQGNGKTTQHAEKGALKIKPSKSPESAHPTPDDVRAPALSTMLSGEDPPTRPERAESNDVKGVASGHVETELLKTVGASKPHGGQTSMANELATPPMRPISGTDAQDALRVDDAVHEMLVAKLEAFYEVVNPDQVDLAERLVNKFNKNAALLNRALREKYGIDLTASEDQRSQYKQGEGVKTPENCTSPVDLDSAQSKEDVPQVGSGEQVLSVNQDFHYFQGFEDIRKTEAGLSAFLTTPPVSALTSKANPSPLIAPANMPSIEEGMPGMSDSGTIAAKIDLDANPYGRCTTVPGKLKCLCGHVEISFRAGLDSVRFCRPEGGESQPTIFFCAVCSMTCWTLDKFGLTTVALDSFRDSEGLLAGDLAVSFHCCYKQRVMDVADDQDKYMDFPAFLGGSDLKAPSSCHGMKPSEAQDDDGQLVHRSSS